MRALLVAALALASPAVAQAISGSIAGTFEGFQSGIPQVRVNVSLACTLTCDAAAPVKHFAIVAGVKSYFASAAAETSGYSALVLLDLDLTGQSSVVSTNFKAGSVNVLKAASVTCHCGNRNGEGGFVDLTSASIIVPPRIKDYLTQRVGFPLVVGVNADLRGAEQIELKAEGAGVSQTKVVGVADVDLKGESDKRFDRIENGAKRVIGNLAGLSIGRAPAWSPDADGHFPIANELKFEFAGTARKLPA